MRFTLALFLVLIAPAALAGERTFRQGADVLRFWDVPCPFASVLRFIPEDQRQQYQKAEGQVAGQRYFACWLDVGDDILHLYWEDGDQGMVPEQALRDEGA